MDVQAIVRRQQYILEEVASLGSFKKGSITHQRMGTSASPDQEDDKGRGAYPLLSWKDGNGKTKSMRLTTPELVAWAEACVAKYQRFKQLTREYEQLAEQAALAEGTSGPETPAAEKKTPKSPRKRKPK